MTLGAALAELEAVSEPQAGEWRRGGRTLAAAAIGVGSGYNLMLWASSLFLLPMEREWHLPRSAVMLAPLIGMMSAVLSPVAGMVVDRFGARRPALLGMLMLAGCYLLMAAVPGNIRLVYAVAVLIGLASTLSNPVLFCRAVGTWFQRRAGLAFSLTMSGMSLMAVVTMPLLAWLMERHGWRAGFIGLAGISLLIGLPVLLGLFHENGTVIAKRRAPSGRLVRSAMRDPRFWRLGVAFGLAGLVIGGVMSNIQPLLIEQGFDALTAATLVSLYTLGIGAGRVGIGWLLDIVDARIVTACSLLAAAIGVLLLSMTGGVYPLALLAAVLIGLGQGAEADFLAFYAIKIFGVEAFGTIFGIFALIVAMGIAGGGMAFALMHDASHSYALACTLAAAAMATSAAIMAFQKVTLEG